MDSVGFFGLNALSSALIALGFKVTIVISSAVSRRVIVRCCLIFPYSPLVLFVLCFCHLPGAQVSHLAGTVLDRQRHSSFTHHSKSNGHAQPANFVAAGPVKFERGRAVRRSDRNAITAKMDTIASWVYSSGGTSATTAIMLDIPLVL
ncbi:hypothetical protein F5144DRAFT_291987 [Chaetomium tenue]|uniref:Uncharacterized protein n=1 Tax=Chaetomium tenue TaxID=1854479 RepID=A0ACB7P224_9PEZI|nr:hypothetical protein F5144DRAFT_291987 [Chaetomium globosum]